MSDFFIEETKKYLNEKKELKNEFGKFSKLYSMTTENIYGLLRNINLENKDVLTVMGSGDQVLNAYLQGADSVTCFDINPLSQIIYDLKKNIITNYDIQVFLSFFDIHNIEYDTVCKKFDNKIIKQLKYYLNESTYNLFDFLYRNNNYLDSLEDILHDFPIDLNTMQIMNNYLTENNYYKLSNILKNKKIKFIESNIVNLKEKITSNKFDLILLSNISDYIHKIYNSNELKSFHNTITSLYDNLKDHGIIEVGYCYDQTHRFTSKFNDDKEREKYFNPTIFETLYVPSYENPIKKDKILIYKK